MGCVVRLVGIWISLLTIKLVQGWRECDYVTNPVMRAGFHNISVLLWVCALCLEICSNKFVLVHVLWVHMVVCGIEGPLA